MAAELAEALHWLTEDQVRTLGSENEHPVFVYSEAVLREQIKKALNFPVNDGYGFQLRFAMKANPNRTVLGIMRDMGVGIDAGSEQEVYRAIKAGYAASDIQLTAQQLAPHLTELIEQGLQFNACSLRQLEEFGKRFPGRSVGVRLNPGFGSGGTVMTNVGGAESSFGIWHQHLDQIQAIVQKYNIKITTVHTHIGSGSDAQVWKAAAVLTLDLVQEFPDATTVNLGGGFKVGRMRHEHSTDLEQVGEPIKDAFKYFYERYGRKLKLEIEPGSFLVVDFGSLIAKVDDVIDTGAQGHRFIKLNAGMDSVTRIPLYGARHPIVIVPQEERSTSETKPFIITGHCCESGDLFTQQPGGHIESRLIQTPQIGDYAVIESTGAYCSSMCSKNYNSYPELGEFMLGLGGKWTCIRKPQTLEQMIMNEL